MAEPQRHTNNLLPPSDNIYRQLLDNWLTQAPSDLVEAAFYIALTHSADASLLAAVLKTPKDVAPLLSHLEGAGLIVAISPSHYAFVSTLRPLALQQWQAEDLQAYRAANAQLADFYRRTQRAGEPEQIEYVYHQLGADDLQGIQALFNAFEFSLATQRLGIAECLLGYADEQTPVLGANAQAWLQYFHARLAMAHHQFAEAETVLHSLTAQQGDPLLRAQAALGLAETLTATQRWAAAQSLFVEAEKLFSQIGDHFNAARTFEARGMAYLDLASSLGGLQEDEVALFEPTYRAWLHRFQHVPFLLYRWFSRRVAFLPNLYFGANYQDWIIIRLFYMAIAQFEEAAHRLAQASTPTDLPTNQTEIDLQIRLADLYHSVGQWVLAQRKLADLLRILSTNPAEQYRLALVRMIQGRVAYTQGRLDVAREDLQFASQVFFRFNDSHALATTNRLLGEVETKAQHYDMATPLFVASIESSLLTNDLLAATQVWSILTIMNEHYRLAPRTIAQIEAVTASLSQRAYVARFPGSLLRTFRLLAFFGVTPVTYWVISQIGVFGGQYLGGFIEILFHQLSSAYAVSVAELTVDAVILIGCVCVGLWSYEWFYLLFGWLFVRRLKIRDLVEQQPQYVVTAPEGIAVRDQHGALTELAWNAVQKQISVDRSFWRTPLALFSRQILIAHPTTLVLDGILSHYQSLKRDLAHHLHRNQVNAGKWTFDFSFLKSPWLFVALLLTFLITAIDFLQLPDQTCRESSMKQVTLRGSEYAYVIDDQGDLRILDIHDFSTPLEVSNYQLPGEAVDLDVTDRYVYLLTDNKGFHIVDIRDRTAPQALGSSLIPGEATGVAVSGEYAYIAAGSQGLRIIDISHPMTPLEVGFYDTPGHASKVAITGKFALVADQSGGLRVINVANPNAPGEVGFYTQGTNAWDVTVSGRYVYVADKDFGLRVIDLANPASPTEVGAVPLQGESLAVASGGSFVTVATANTGIHVIHVWDPTNPYEVGVHKMPGIASALSVAVLAYVTSNVGGVHIVDILNPCDEITELGSSSEIQAARSIAMLKPYSLLVTSLLYIFLDWARFIFPLQAVVRLIYNRAQLRRALGDRIYWPTELALWLASVILCYWMLEKMRQIAE